MKKLITQFSFNGTIYFLYRIENKVVFFVKVNNELVQVSEEINQTLTNTFFVKDEILYLKKEKLIALLLASGIILTSLTSSSVLVKKIMLKNNDENLNLKDPTEIITIIDDNNLIEKKLEIEDSDLPIILDVIAEDTQVEITEESTVKQDLQSDNYEILTEQNNISNENVSEEKSEANSQLLADTISKYKLEDYQILIYANADLFLNILGVIDNNPNFTEFLKGEFLKCSNYLFNNKDYINFDVLLQNLAILNFTTDDISNNQGASAYYTRIFDEDGNKIPIIVCPYGYETLPAVLKHEIIHLVGSDAILETYSTIYYNETENKFTNENNNIVTSFYGTWFEESMTETLTQEYNYSNSAGTYRGSSNILSAIALTMRDERNILIKSYQSEDKIVGLLNYFLEKGFTFNEINDIFTRFELYHNIKYGLNYNDLSTDINYLTIQVIDDLIYIYEKTTGLKWQDNLILAAKLNEMLIDYYSNLEKSNQEIELDNSNILPFIQNKQDFFFYYYPEELQEFILEKTGNYYITYGTVNTLIFNNPSDSNSIKIEYLFQNKDKWSDMFTLSVEINVMDNQYVVTNYYNDLEDVSNLVY